MFKRFLYTTAVSFIAEQTFFQYWKVYSSYISTMLMLCNKQPPKFSGLHQQIFFAHHLGCLHFRLYKLYSDLSAPYVSHLGHSLLMIDSRNTRDQVKPFTFPKTKSKKVGICITYSAGRHCKVRWQRIWIINSVMGKDWRNGNSNLPQKYFNLIMSVCHWINCPLWCLNSWADILVFPFPVPSLSLLSFSSLTSDFTMTVWDPH